MKKELFEQQETIKMTIRIGHKQKMPKRGTRNQGQKGNMTKFLSFSW